MSRPQGNKWIGIAAVSGFCAVMIGAFGAHGLESVLSEKMRANFETGVRYHFYHTFALLACGILHVIHPSKHLERAAICFLTGVVLFSGSLYVLAITGITKLGMITPIGGLAFLAGWITLLLHTIKPPQHPAKER